MLFTLIMKQILSYSLKKNVILFVLIFVFSCNFKEETDFSERTKIALRDAGNKLLLSSKDSVSLILPVKKLESQSYQLTFSQPLYFEPSTLVNSVDASFKRARLSEYYRVEVLQCSDAEVAYSYQMSEEEEYTIIPCAGRYLPKACYIIKLKFINKTSGFAIHKTLTISILLLTLISIGFLVFKKTKPKTSDKNQENMEKIGSFCFYPDENKLVKEAEEIALSKKECELLALFVANPNHIIKRDELNKRVWEDNGVFVGRSLDTYISKLRKKLKADTSIKLTNVHGVGYKLETG
jgi:hypothetical protein